MRQNDACISPDERFCIVIHVYYFKGLQHGFCDKGRFTFLGSGDLEGIVTLKIEISYVFNQRENLIAPGEVSQKVSLYVIGVQPFSFSTDRGIIEEYFIQIIPYRVIIEEYCIQIIPYRKNTGKNHTFYHTTNAYNFSEVPVIV